MDNDWLEHCLTTQWTGLYQGWTSITELRYYLRGMASALIATNHTYQAADMQWLCRVLDTLEQLPREPL